MSVPLLLLEALELAELNIEFITTGLGKGEGGGAVLSFEHLNMKSYKIEESVANVVTLFCTGLVVDIICS